ncbi:Hypothetical predicted protein, partial [Podarcis lilfordi]
MCLRGCCNTTCGPSPGSNGQAPLTGGDVLLLRMPGMSGEAISTRGSSLSAPAPSEEEA